MKKIFLFLLAGLMIGSSCNYEQEQLFDREKDPVAPVLTIEGATQFVITEELPDFYYTVLTWSRANFGKGVSANYTLQVSDNEDFTGDVKTIPIGEDVYLRALTAAELYGWAIDDYGVYDSETDRIEPATLYFKILAQATGVSQPVYSNTETMTSKWEKGAWIPVELTIHFKVVSGDWGEYAVYAWGDAEVYGGWPGRELEATPDGWYTIIVPTNRPINLIINNNGNGKQFDFLKNPTESLSYEFKIGPGNNDCEWTVVEGGPVTDPTYPSEMYMIGEEFGGWSWSSDGVAVMTPVWGYEGHFWAVRYISAGKGFKWCAVRDWNGDFFSLGEDIGFYTSSGNAFVETDGMYMVYMDMVHGKISVEPAKVYGMGPCFGGWDTATHPFEVEDKTMVFTTVDEGELRIYAASDISPVGNDWWKMEFVILDGKIAYRGTGGDQTRVPVDAGKTIVLDFNAGTGTIE